MAKYHEAKAKQRKLHEKVKALKIKNAPILEFKESVASFRVFACTD